MSGTNDNKLMCNGLDKFRQDMLTDKHMRKLVDYGNSKDVFPSVVLAGGACYFLWERDYQGPVR